MIETKTDRYNESKGRIKRNDQRTQVITKTKIMKIKTEFFKKMEQQIKIWKKINILMRINNGMI